MGPSELVWRRGEDYTHCVEHRRYVAAGGRTIRGVVVLMSLILLLTVGCTALPEHDLLPHARASSLLLVVHGAGASPRGWPRKLISTITGRYPQARQWQIVAYDWETEAAKVLTAAKRGYRIGRAIAEELLNVDDPIPYDRLHLIAHSVGSHLIQGFTDAIRDAAGGSQPTIQMTFLDPFVARGVLRWRWGARVFGRGADLAECYISVEDGVPGTKSYLELAANTDVTALVPRRYRDNASQFHWWPVEYYRQLIEERGFPHSVLLGPLEPDGEPGSVTVLPR